MTASIGAMDDINLDDPVSVIATLTDLRNDDMFPPWSLLVALSYPDSPGGLMLVIEEAPPDPPQHERVEVLGSVLNGLSKHEIDVGGVLLAHVRPGSADIRGHDLAWLDALTTAAQAADIRIHGVYAMTDDCVTRVVVPAPVE